MALVALMDTHRGVLEYDWRHRFHLPLDVVGETMTWGEALRLTEVLASDPTSHTAACLAGWDYPVSHEAIVLMNLFDLEHHIAWAQGGGKGQRPTPHNRPWPDDSRHNMAPAATLTQDQIIDALVAAGHAPPSP